MQGFQSKLFVGGEWFGGGKERKEEGKSTMTRAALWQQSRAKFLAVTCVVIQSSLPQSESPPCIPRIMKIRSVENPSDVLSTFFSKHAGSTLGGLWMRKGCQFKLKKHKSWFFYRFVFLTGLSSSCRQSRHCCSSITWDGQAGYMPWVLPNGRRGAEGWRGCASLAHIMLHLHGGLKEAVGASSVYHRAQGILGIRVFL